MSGEASDFNNVFDFPAMGALHGSLTPGARGWEVEELQKRLARVGFDIGVGGVYDGAVTAVVKILQRAMKRPDTGVYDSYIDAALRRAVDFPASMEAAAFALAAQDWKTKKTNAIVGTVTAATNPSPLPPVVQVVDDGPIWKKPAFWLALGAGGIALYALTRSSAPTYTERAALPPGEQEEGVDDPQGFFSEPPKKRKKRKKPAKKKPIPATASPAPDEDPPGGIEDEPGDVDDEDVADAPAAEAVVEIAAVEPAPKPKKKRKRKKLPERDAGGQFLPQP